MGRSPTPPPPITQDDPIVRTENTSWNRAVTLLLRRASVSSVLANRRSSRTLRSAMMRSCALASRIRVGLRISQIRLCLLEARRACSDGSKGGGNTSSPSVAAGSDPSAVVVGRKSIRLRLINS